MKALAKKSPSQKAHIAKRFGNKNGIHSSPRRAFAFANHQPIIQRKPGCPCGGGCPRCKEEEFLHAKLKIGEPNDKYEQEADRVADMVMRMPQPGLDLGAIQGFNARWASRAPLLQRSPEVRLNYERSRWGSRRDPFWGRERARDRDRSGGPGPALEMNRAETEAVVREEVEFLRPHIPEWYDADEMATFDSWFYGEPGRFDFRGRAMKGWEVNYYFISMAMAHQGWDWAETQLIIWSWNQSQRLPGVAGDPLMTDEMWFAADQGFFDEIERIEAEL